MTPGSFGYSVLRNSVESDFYHALLSTCETMDMPLEGLHTETGPGVLEACITVDHALAAADKAALFKTFAKVVAQRRNLMATFMAKWSGEQAGQGGHIHLSLRDSGGNAAFHDPACPHGISKTMRHFIAGQQALLPELLALVAPTVNSYSRLVPGFWAPTNATWASKTAPAPCALFPDRPSHNGWSTGCRAPTPTRISLSRLPSHRGCGGSNISWSRSRLWWGMDMRRRFRRTCVCRPRWGKRRGG